MAIDFPVATTVGQIYTDPVSGSTFVVTVVGPPAQWVGSGSSTNLDATYLRKDASNDPVTGTLTVTPSTNVTGLVVTQPSGNSAAAMRITNEGSGYSFLVEDAASTDSTPFVIRADGTIGIGTTSAVGALDVVSSQTSGITINPSSTQGNDTNRGIRIRNNSTSDTFSISYRGLAYFASQVGIGTTVPRGRLNVRLDTTTATPGGSSSIIISNRNASLASGAMAGGIFADMYRDVSDPAYAAGIWFNRQQVAGGLDSGGDIVFGTNNGTSTTSAPTERMRIQSDGIIRMINPTTPLSWGSPTDNKWSISPNNDDFYIANSNFSKYAVLQTQNFTGWTFASDRRIKENIVDLDYGIDQLKQIKARRFNFIGDATSSIGFIAQELQEVIPEAVTGTEIPFAEEDTQQDKASKTMGITRDTLIPIIVKALQEAVIKIETLEAKVVALEGV